MSAKPRYRAWFESLDDPGERYEAVQAAPRLRRRDEVLLHLEVGKRLELPQPRPIAVHEPTDRLKGRGARCSASTACSVLGGEKWEMQTQTVPAAGMWIGGWIEDLKTGRFLKSKDKPPTDTVRTSGIARGAAARATRWPCRR